ncbi:hypothetical protein SLA2020_405550 [Shorea laevis]
MRVLDTIYGDEEQGLASPKTVQYTEQQVQSVPESATTKDQSTPFKQVLGSSPNMLSTIHPVIEFDRHTLIRHALAEKYDDCFRFPQILASCIFALIQSASEIAAIVSPHKAILDIYKHRSKYSEDGEDVQSLRVTWWFRGIGGFVAAMGFFLCWEQADTLPWWEADIHQ